MASVLDQLPLSTLSLVGNGFNVQNNQPAWGYADNTNNLNPAVSKLHYIYSVDGNPNVRLKDFNRNGASTTVRPPANLDELDPIAPNNTALGVRGGIYKSPVGQRYKEKGPQPGKY